MGSELLWEVRELWKSFSLSFSFSIRFYFFSLMTKEMISSENEMMEAIWNSPTSLNTVNVNERSQEKSSQS